MMRSERPLGLPKGISTLHKTLTGLAFLAAYIALDYISFVRPFHGLGITPCSPPPGLSLTLIYLGGPFYAPFVLIAPALAEFVVRGSSLSAGLALATSLTSGATYLTAGLLLRRITPFDPRLQTLRDVLVLIVLAGASAAVASALYLAVLVPAGALTGINLADVAWRAFVGDLIGTLVVTPLVLLAFTRRAWPPLQWQNMFQLIAIAVSLAIVFGYREATAFQLFYLLFLPLLWVALSHGTVGAAVALVLIQVGLIFGAQIRFGDEPGLTAMQVLMTTLAITGMIVGAIVSERESSGLRLRDQQAALNRALRLRSAGETAAAIAHEINQPLTAITTYAGIASDAMRSSNHDLVALALDKIRGECERTNTVIKSIRELLNHGSLTKMPIDLEGSLTSLAAIISDDLATRGIRLEIAVAHDFPVILADGVQLQQAVHNLIVNSADAISVSGNGGTISVMVSRAEPNGYQISVADDGPGFPSEIDTREPTPFLTTKPEGSGLGLMVVRTIAEAHGGSLSIESSPRGAKVSLRLPLGRTTNERRHFNH
jgi:two-component system sensor kinase FixL